MPTEKKTDVPRWLRLPGLRRYALRVEKLQAELRRTKKELHTLRKAYEREAPDRHLLAEAQHYRFYWERAFKHIDIRSTEPFGALATRIVAEQRTFLGVDRPYTLWQAVHDLPRDARAVAEVGSYKGGSARFIAEALQHCGRQMPLYVCDTFQGHAVVDASVDGRHEIGRHFKVKFDKVVRYLEPFDFVRIIRGDITKTATQLEGEQAFGLVHLDVDVYPATRFCLDFFASRLVPRGVIIVDDYGSKSCAGVMKAVGEFIEANPAFRMLHLLTGQAVLVHAPIALQEIVEHQ